MREIIQKAGVRTRTIETTATQNQFRGEVRQRRLGRELMKSSETKVSNLKRKQLAPLGTPTDLKAAATKDISGTLNGILADVFALYLKTKNFHWHMSGPHFRDYHLLLDEQADQLYAMTDLIAERIRKVGGTTLRTIANIAST